MGRFISALGLPTLLLSSIFSFSFLPLFPIFRGAFAFRFSRPPVTKPSACCDSAPSTKTAAYCARAQLASARRTETRTTRLLHFEYYFSISFLRFSISFAFAGLFPFTVRRLPCASFQLQFTSFDFCAPSHVHSVSSPIVRIVVHSNLIDGSQSLGFIGI